MKSLRSSLGGQIPPGRFRFHEPDPDRTFNTLADVVFFVAEFRRSNNVAVDHDELRAEIENWICEQIGSVEYYCNEDGQPIPMRQFHEGNEIHGTGYDGSEKWQELHLWALNGEQNPVARAEWMLAFIRSLPCGDCRRGWRRLIGQFPPPYEASPRDLFYWTWQRHNDIRRRLRQSELSLRDAMELYSVESVEQYSVNPAWPDVDYGYGGVTTGGYGYR